ncbi:MAG: glycoside hydrolase family 3 C-terminal domain-containing protein, partial [Muribaculaceae bacterium]|nr:glycoside hydrolase family 3 C-terminal domain-containing protein [Muribaculaceae bacterium]
NNLYTREKIARDKKEAIKIAINAGIDMAMEPYSWDYCTLLKELVEEGEVPMERIDDATRRVLRLKYRLGLFDNPTPQLKDYPDFGSRKFADAARRAAVESMILLKNDNNTLPVKAGAKILVTGPNANSMRSLNGGWTVTWQGKLRPEELAEKNTILEAVENRFGKENVTYVPGVTYNEDGAYGDENAPDFAPVARAAQDADVVLVCVGENSYTETPGNLSDLNLSENQKELVRVAAAAGKPVVMILNEGRARVINDVEPLAAAIVDILLPGSEGGDALASLLAGDENFSGRLPYTYPRSVNALSTYDYKASEQVGTMAGAYDYNASVTHQWPFAHGLSYTTFRYDNLRVDKDKFVDGDNITFSIDVTNTGDRKGKETVMLFTSDLVASRLVPDNRRLRAFDKVEIEPGRTKTVTLTIPASDLAYVGPDGKWILEEGDFKACIGGMEKIITCTQTTEYPGQNKEPVRQ